MAVRSRRIFGPLVLPTGAYSQLYAVPADRTARVLSLTITNNGAVAQGVLLRQGSPGFLPWYQSPAVPVGQSIVVDLVWVLNEGDVVQGIAGGAGMTMHANGSLLLGDPS